MARQIKEAIFKRGNPMSIEFADLLSTAPALLESRDGDGI
jgi:hypothetical protein